MQKIFDIIANSFTEQELSFFEEIDSQGNIWTFREQVEDRYSYKYPSLASLSEMQEYIVEKINKFRPALNKETAPRIKELILDSLEKEIFISHHSYLCNQVMMENLLNNQIKTPDQKGIVKVVDHVLNQIDPEIQKQLVLTINGRTFSLREQLLKRYAESRYFGKGKWFTKGLFFEQIYNPCSVYRGKNKKITKVHLFAFLNSLDEAMVFMGRGEKYSGGRIGEIKKQMLRKDLEDVYCGRGGFGGYLRVSASGKGIGRNMSVNTFNSNWNYCKIPFFNGSFISLRITDDFKLPMIKVSWLLIQNQKSKKLSTPTTKKIIKDFSDRYLFRGFIFSRYRNFLRMAEFIQSNLTEKQKEVFKFKFGGLELSFYIQLIAYFETRYLCDNSTEQMIENVQKIFERYDFLFSTQLNNEEIRDILLNEIIEVNTGDSQMFYMALNTRYQKSKHHKLREYKHDSGKNKRNRRHRYSITICDRGVFNGLTKMKNSLLKSIEERYPNLPLRETSEKYISGKLKLVEELLLPFWGNQIELENINISEWEKKVMKRIKYSLERLLRCEPEYRDKYRERIMQEINISLGMIPHYGHIPINTFRIF